MSIRKVLRSPPPTQARSSTTFQPPPLDGSLILPEIFDWHLQHTPNHRLFVFAREDDTIRTIYWPEAVRAVHTGARIVRDRVKEEAVVDESPVVAILAPSDAIPYFTIMMSILRANCVAFPISPRNSPVAVAHLIHRTGIKHILVGREQAMVNLAHAAFDILKMQYPSTALPVTSPMPLFEELFLPSTESVDFDKELPYVFRGSDATAMILHSSGSTAFPKPIYWSNHRFLQLCLIPWYGERDLTDQIFSLHTMPMYHGMGVLQLCWTASSGLVVSSFEPKSPVPVPTPDALFKAAKATNSDIIFCVPTFIEAWSRNPEYVSWLATRGGVLFGGGPLNKEAGDHMTSQGVSIFILYGSTEGGIMSPILPAKVGYDWDYFRFPDLVTPKMVAYGNNTFEFVMVSNDVCTPSVLNTKVDGIDSYATSDLMMPHPTKPGYWRVYGRTDDQIMHNTGEKTNPGPLENMLNQDPHVLSSVMFGRGRFQAGILIDPKPEFRFDPADLVKLAEFRNRIWPTIERMNAYAPQHSRLFKEMVIVAKPSKPFTYTAKNTARRQAVIDDYADEINALYDIVEESTQSNIPPPSHWDIVSAIDFVRAVVRKVLVNSIQDDDDFFQYGCDSLQATWIRNSLLRALRDSAQLDTRKTVGNFIYDHPSILRLAAFISSLASGASEGTDASVQSRVDAMKAMVDKYSGYFPARPLELSSPVQGNCVLLTGTTGSLGSHTLAKLVSNPRIRRVYAFNRGSKEQTKLSDRQRSALAGHGIGADMLSSEKIILLEGDLTVAYFGLPSSVYDEMHRSVTQIVHNAWRVDFNLALTSFEPNVKGLRSLVDFALTSPLREPPRIIYTSSIGIFQDIKGDGIQAEQPVSAEVAVGNGYVESKWVSEQILYNVSAKAPLRALVVRVGQVCGGPNGAWNLHEWFPSIVQSAPKLNCFPDDDRRVSWIPLDMAASALADYCTDSGVSNVVHLIHPRPVPWSTIARAVSSELSVPLVSYAEWLSKLQEAIGSSSTANQDTPVDIALLRGLRALRLLPFFKQLAKIHGGDALSFPSLAATEAIVLSPTLANSDGGQVGPDDVKKWLSYWRGAGLFSLNKEV